MNFENIEESTKAKEKINGKELEGYTIRVDYSITKWKYTSFPEIRATRHKSKSSDDEEKRTYDTPKPKRSFFADDWKCARCSRANWTRKPTCNMCNESNPNRGRQGTKKGSTLLRKLQGNHT